MFIINHIDDSKDNNFKDLFEKHQRGLIFSVAPEEELQKFDRLMGFLMYVSDN